MKMNTVNFCDRKVAFVILAITFSTTLMFSHVNGDDVFPCQISSPNDGVCVDCVNDGDGASKCTMLIPATKCFGAVKWTPVFGPAVKVDGSDLDLKT